MRNKWKDKAQERSKENIRLRKRIKELTYSRDKWKVKYFEEGLSYKKGARQKKHLIL